MNMNLCQHAKVRMQQRGIPPLIVDCLLRFGHREPSGNGACKCYFDKRSYRKLEAYAGPLAGKLREFLDVYIVLGGNSEIITIAHRLERARRH